MQSYYNLYTWYCYIYADDFRREYLLDIAIDDKQFDLALFLVNHGCGDDDGKEKLLFAACYLDNLDIVKELIEKHKVDPKSEIIITLHTCSLACSYIIV